MSFLFFVFILFPGVPNLIFECHGISRGSCPKSNAIVRFAKDGRWCRDAAVRRRSMAQGVLGGLVAVDPSPLRWSGGAVVRRRRMVHGGVGVTLDPSHFVGAEVLLCASAAWRMWGWW